MEKNLEAKIEAILFINGETVPFVTLQKILEVESKELQDALEAYRGILEARSGGLILVTDSKSARLAVKSEYQPILESLVKSELQAGLSKAALEVLAMVAYLGPVARVEIDAIRGVNSSFTLRNLAIRGLIERRGNPSDARGYVYEASMEFLTTLGIEDIQALPGYEGIRNDERLNTLQGKAASIQNFEEGANHEEA
jgi:segregation and condensation protein B